MKSIEQIRIAGKGLITLTVWGKSFKLVRETNWSLFYQYKEDTLRISKVRAGIVDISLFKLNPSDLEQSEQIDAAISLYGLGDGSEYLSCKIPDSWQIFSRTVCDAL